MRCGRKLKLTDSTIRDLEAAISIGATIDIACAYAGVSDASYYSWMRQGREALEKLEEDPDAVLSKNEQTYLKFLDAMEKAHAYTAVSWLQVVSDATISDPAWAMRMLKIRYPDDFREVEARELDVTSGGEKVKGYTILANPDQWPDPPADDGA